MGLLINNLYTQYQDNNEEKFNKEFIYQRKLKHTQNTIECLEDACKALEVIEGITFLGSSVITDESVISNTLKKHSKDINENRFILISISFKLEKEDEEKIVTIPILFPKLIDDFYYILNGSRYTAIYQMID
jgi:hypothetical protein